MARVEGEYSKYFFYKNANRINTLNPHGRRSKGWGRHPPPNIVPTKIQEIKNNDI